MCTKSFNPPYPADKPGNKALGGFIRDRFDVLTYLFQPDKDAAWRPLGIPQAQRHRALRLLHWCAPNLGNPGEYNDLTRRVVPDPAGGESTVWELLRFDCNYVDVQHLCDVYTHGMGNVFDVAVHHGVVDVVLFPIGMGAYLRDMYPNDDRVGSHAELPVARLGARPL